MVYPADGLSVLTPIIFFILLFAFPVIGVFAGWKRAAYWGGGNLAFYILGLIIWRTAGPAICNAFIPMLKQMLGGDYNVSTLVYSIISPAFFIILMLVANIILVICYYTFAKKLIGIGKYDKNSQKQNKENKNTKAKQVKAVTKSGKATQIVNSNWFNKVVGGVGLTVLMLPITLSTTHAIAMTTTSVNTRKSNALAGGLYDGLQNTSGAWHWFSFYCGKNAGEDYNFLFSALAVTQEKITIDGVTYSGTEALTKALPNAATELSNEINKIGTITSENINQATQACDTFINKLNTIVTGLGADNLGAMVNSNGGQDLMSDLIPGGTITITADKVKQQLSEGSVTDTIKKAIENEKDGKYTVEIEGVGTFSVTAVKEQIPVDQESFDKLASTAVGMFKVDGEVTEDVTKGLQELSTLLIGLIFEVR